MNKKTVAMEISEVKDFLYRVLSIDLSKYLTDLGFTGKKVEDDMTAFVSPFHPDIIVVDHRDNTWTSIVKLEDNLSIIDFGTDFYACSRREFLDRIKLDPHLPDQHHLDAVFREQQMPYHVLSDFGTVGSEASVSFFAHMNLPLDFVNRYCQEFQLRLGDDPQMHTAIKLSSQQDLNHLFIMKKMESEIDSDGEELATYWGDDLCRKVDFHLIDRGSKNIDVFVAFPDLLARQHEYDRLGMQAPSQLLLSTPYAFEQARPVMERHENINLFFPNSSLCDLHKLYGNWLSPKYKDFSPMYAEHPTLAYMHSMQRGTGQLHHKHGRGL